MQIFRAIIIKFIAKNFKLNFIEKTWFVKKQTNKKKTKNFKHLKKLKKKMATLVAPYITLSLSSYALIYLITLYVILYNRFRQIISFPN